ncbi:hypothetical protein [Endozoicomonas sp. SCSIO W0465]|uniref:hypothetical protein n=1 Tax=Endozoicomonas sp. SCSIO W0465 TaxID=2918516 RepID=UPI002075A39A|nr:hypothetical protein [Endozoicomonas sp. SCSIO W0465]USE33778.1 hypothetical protein MJO57_16485 [Endozoicomonas sp. SCSIO W0465]
MVHHRTKPEVSNPLHSGSSTTYQKVIDNYDKLVEGLYDYQIKKLARRLTNKGVISSGEFFIVCSKPAGSSRARSLLDMVTMPSNPRLSPDTAASRFEQALRLVNPELAGNIFNHQG